MRSRLLSCCWWLNSNAELADRAQSGNGVDSSILDSISLQLLDHLGSTLLVLLPSFSSLGSSCGFRSLVIGDSGESAGGDLENLWESMKSAEPM